MQRGNNSNKDMVNCVITRKFHPLPMKTDNVSTYCCLFPSASKPCICGKFIFLVKKRDLQKKVKKSTKMYDKGIKESEMLEKRLQS